MLVYMIQQLKIHKIKVLYKFEKNARIQLLDRATMDLNRGTFEAWNLPEDAGKIVA